MYSMGSPTPSKMLPCNSLIEQSDDDCMMGMNRSKAASKAELGPSPLITSKPDILPLQLTRGASIRASSSTESKLATDKLMAILHEQNMTRGKQSHASSSISSAPSKVNTRLSPTAQSFRSSSSVSHALIDSYDIEDLQNRLQAANLAIKERDQEISQMRITSSTLDSVMSQSSAAGFPLGSVRPSALRADSWAPGTTAPSLDFRPTSGHSDGYLNRGLLPVRPIWNDVPHAQVNVTAMKSVMPSMPPTEWKAPHNLRSLVNGHGNPTVTYVNTQVPGLSQAEHGFTAPHNMPQSAVGSHGYPSNLVGTTNRPALNDLSVMYVTDEAYRRGVNVSRPLPTTGSLATGPIGSRAAYTYTNNQAYLARPVTPHGGHNSPAYSGNPGPHGLQPSAPALGPIGSRLSPTANSFAYTSNPTPWNVQPSFNGNLTTGDHVNYRRLLDRGASCDWNVIVDKIIQNNDQQASIFLQHKLKSCPTDQKFEIINSIIAQAFNLMINRFGNFLVQRCFEHGTHEQVIKIAQSIQGHTLDLAMDAFGCHVVQKAFDCVPEQYKAIMVHELLRRIPETVVHRYACHVWQKLFELRWSDSPPQIMKYVNEALRGMWHEVALGETGSLVVQNIFENCLEEDKRPCIDEILMSIDAVSHGQFGNWCIQHICEHGANRDRNRAIDHVLRFATQYSTDQYASKVVEKCLKIGGNEFLERYLERVCEVRLDRPRLAIIDIASDQFGNYLVQWILGNSQGALRDDVANHIRKHMVSLRGSKYGSRVAMICNNQHSVLPSRPNAAATMHQLPNRPTHGSGYHHGYSNGYNSGGGYGQNSGYNGSASYYNGYNSNGNNGNSGNNGIVAGPRAGSNYNYN